MDIDWDLVIKIMGPVVGAAAGAYAKHLAEDRADVVAFLQHAAGVQLPGANPPSAIGTHTVVLANNGRKAATDLRLGHANLPEFSISPPIDYAVHALPNGHKEIRIPTLIPKKQLTITYLYLAPLQWGQVNTHLEHDAGQVRVIRVLPMVQRPLWLRRILWCLAGIGLVTSIYLTSQLVAYVYARAAA